MLCFHVMLFSMLWDSGLSIVLMLFLSLSAVNFCIEICLLVLIVFYHTVCFLSILLVWLSLRIHSCIILHYVVV